MPSDHSSVTVVRRRVKSLRNNLVARKTNASKRLESARLPTGVVNSGLAFHTGIALPQRHDGGDLHGLEHSVIVIAFDRGEGLDHLTIAGAEADAPTGHVVAFAHRREFDAHLGCSR